MNNSASITLLNNIQWMYTLPSWLDNITRSWLTDRGSMTHRLECYCSQIRVRRFREGFITTCIEPSEAMLLPGCERFWLREVVLYGYEKPWITARTLVPAIKKTKIIQNMLNLGDLPLGKWLFCHHLPIRDIIQFGRINNLWARRSRLLADGQVLLLTEMFLPDCPLYGFTNYNTSKIYQIQKHH